MYTDEQWDYAHVFNAVRNNRHLNPFACSVVIEFSPLAHLPVEEKDLLIEEATGRRLNSDYSGWETL